MNNFCIVILAAGEGKRMKSSRPKVLHEICSKPMINYVLDAAKLMQPKKTIVVIGKKRPQVREALPKDVTVVFQEKPQGTADAVKAAKKQVPSSVRNVIVLYGDIPLLTEETIRRLYDQHIENDYSCTVLTTFLDNPKGYGRILRNDSGQLIGIIEDKDASYQQKSIREINTGIYCFKNEDLWEGLEHVKPYNQNSEFYLTDVVRWLFNKNKKICASVALDANEVLGVNSVSELMFAQEIIRKRILIKYIESGVRIADASTIFIDETAKIGPDTEILPFTFIEKDVVIGKNCFVGPYCHLRQGAILCDKVSVGNFTEIKNSKLDEETSVRHLSYIGDTQLGKKVNVGAGAVVANFDGKRKHKTVVRDKAFIGCNSVLIAPVVIGKKAIVGAGSVVTSNHNVPDGAIVAGVPAKNIKDSKKRR